MLSFPTPAAKRNLVSSKQCEGVDVGGRSLGNLQPFGLKSQAVKMSRDSKRK